MLGSADAAQSQQLGQKAKQSTTRDTCQPEGENKENRERGRQVKECCA